MFQNTQISNVFPQWEYSQLRGEQAMWVAGYKKTLSDNELADLNTIGFKPNLRMDDDVIKYGNSPEAQKRAYWAKKVLMAELSDAELRKAGVTTSLGYNFIDLRPPVYLLYPVNTPMRNELPREGRVNDGVGVLAQWYATRNPGVLSFGVPEGQRAAIATPDRQSYAGAYKEGGVERGVTFTAQVASEGYTDQLADEHLRGLHELMLAEEGTIWNGNGGTGTGGNGLVLGTATAPTSTLVNVPSSIANGTKISAAVVPLTAMGYPNNSQYGYGANSTVTGGVVTKYTVTGADGGTYTVPGGAGIVSPMSALSAATAAGTPSVQFSVAPIKGAVAYAWYIDVIDQTTPSASNAFLAAITTSASYTVSANPTGTQTAASIAAAGDNSFWSLEFTGLIPYVAATPGATWINQNGASFTAAGHGMVVEVENLLANTFAQFQTGYTAIWGSPDAIRALSQAIVASGTANTGYQLIITQDKNNNVVGGYVVSGYISRYAVNSPTGANVIPLRMHPMIPAGTLYFDIGVNPYPHSRLGNTRAMLVQRDYYAIEWPVTTRQWTWGTYVHEVLAHRMPWIPAVITGIGPYTGS